MLQRIRNSFYTKVIAVYMVLSLVGDIVYPVVSYGLTSGPIDINQASFEPASTSEMVNLATGDFTYNIPLMDVDGYPINIAYHGGVSMEQEASMVGLGWSLNVGSMNRIKKGLPDDFNGDEIETTMNIRPVENTLMSIGSGVEVIGYDSPSASYNVDANSSIGITFNNYMGYGVDIESDISGSGSLSGSLGKFHGGIGANLGLSLISSSQSGFSISPSANLSSGLGRGNFGLVAKIGIGFTMNTFQGISSINKSFALGGSRKGANGGVGVSGSFPISTVSYTPSIAFETNSTMSNMDFDLGWALPGTAFQGKGVYSKSLSCLNESTQQAKGYGYMYEQNHNVSENYLLDYNIEGRVIPNENIAYLPVVNHTFDIFNATAQGVGFSSRLFRSDVLALSQANKINETNGGSYSGEVAVGSPPLNIQAGFNVNNTTGSVETGKWIDDNFSDNEFVANNNPSSTYEHAFFKKFGNRSSSNSEFYTSLGKDEAYRQGLARDGVVHKGLNSFVSKMSLDVTNLSMIPNLVFESIDFSSISHLKESRDLRNTSIEYLTSEEASSFGLSNLIESYSLNDYTLSVNDEYNVNETIPRQGSVNNGNNAKAHHLSEMSVLKGDGSRYVYGIPVVNKSSSEVTFNVSDKTSSMNPPLTKDHLTGLVTYSPGIDNSTENRRGDNNMYVKKKVPSSASSFLLSAYLSSNYVDRTGDGPTEDDFGSYTKFNYSKQGVTKWRFPFEENKAFYNEGLKSNDYDDMGLYMYGEREQWLPHSIESKNFVAEFHYSERYDAHGVIDENGGIDVSDVSKKLDYISLYTKEGKKNGEAPIKTVHFDYGYDLCKGVPNNNNPDSNQNGKLTLLGLYFTYGDSQRGKLHKYNFDYGVGMDNPNYSLGQSNRWGTFSPQVPNSGFGFDDALGNFEFPYVNQDSDFSNNNAKAWMLKKIRLPSGSEISIEVESDDYSGLQDKTPSEMYMIKGVSREKDSEIINNLYDFIDTPADIINGLTQPNNYLHVKLNQHLGSNYSEALSSFRSNYIKDLGETKMYFKFLVKVSPFGSITALEKHEFISGYADVDINDIDVTLNDQGYYDVGVIKMKYASIEGEPSIGSSGVSQISKASWQFIRKYLPRSINAQAGSIYTGKDGVPYTYDCGFIESFPENTDDSDPTSNASSTDEDNSSFQGLYNIGISQLQNALTLGGITNMMKIRGFASSFEPNKSWVRLYQGNDKKKIGGGHRVKQITVNDNWDDVKNMESNSEYGTQYNYKAQDNFGDVISSGVASYEPITSGADENTFRTPVDYTLNVVSRVNDEEFQEKPLGESIFANPQVVYSQVEVENVSYQNINNSSAGSTVYEFYTSKDFPSIVKDTDRPIEGTSKLVDESSGSILETFFGGDNFYNVTLSQGTSICINDMAGKFKRKKVLRSDGVEIYSLEHKYFTSETGKLVNKLPVIDETGVISERYIGKDIDMTIDLNYSKSYTETSMQSYGLDYTFPLTFLPSFWFNSSSQENKFQSSSTTKVVYSSGILEEIVLKDKGRVKKSKNLLFDSKTGVPIVTEIQAEEDGVNSQSIYQYDYPAYWAYKGMGLASENWGAVYTNLLNTDGVIAIANASDLFNPGDEIAIKNNSTNNFVDAKYWVVKNETNNELFLVDRVGDVIPSTYIGSEYSYKVLRSGKRNLLGSTFQSVTSLDNNVNIERDNEENIISASSPYDNNNVHSNVLNVSAVEYTDEAFGYKDLSKSANSDCGLVLALQVNPYIEGLRGNWNLLASYVYDTDRLQDAENIRIDGTLVEFVEYWVRNQADWVKNIDPLVAQKWIIAATSTIVEREGYNLESKDALNIYSSILLGYNNTLKTAEAVNSRYYEIGYDGFEDREYDIPGYCTTPHFRLNGTIADIAHTGRHSLKIPGTRSLIKDIIKSNSIDHTTVPHSMPYLVQNQEMINPYTFLLSPTESKKYVLTAWVKEDIEGEQVISYNANLIVSGSTIIKETRSNIIDGWQRIELIFELPAETIVGEAGVPIEFNAPINDVYFDDVRLQPFNSEMVSYVIDPISLRLWATLDSRNFATFYQYDEEGSLVRIIQETERGKVTVQENRAGIKIINND